MKDFFGQSRADHRKGCPFRWETGGDYHLWIRTERNPDLLSPAVSGESFSGKGSCRAGGVSRMREAEEELLSLEREDSAFSSAPRLTQDSEAGKASAFGARSADNSCFTKNGAHSGAIGRAGRTAGAVHTANGAAGARPSENTGTFPVSHLKIIRRRGITSRRMADNGTLIILRRKNRRRPRAKRLPSGEDGRDGARDRKRSDGHGACRTACRSGGQKGR